MKKKDLSQQKPLISRTRDKFHSQSGGPIEVFEGGRQNGKGGGQTKKTVRRTKEKRFMGGDTSPIQRTALGIEIKDLPDKGQRVPETESAN